MPSRTARRRLVLPAVTLLLSYPGSSNAHAADADKSKQPIGISSNDVGGATTTRQRQRPRARRVASATTNNNSQSPYYLHHSTYRRLSTECTSSNQHLFLLNFQTDSYGSETSWSLKLKNDNGGNSSSNTYIGYGPPEGISYGDFKLYSFSYCLNVGSTYTLSMEDNFGDGMCCTRGYGGYEYYIGGSRIYSTNLLHTFTDYVEHTFTVEDEYTPSPTMTPTEEPIFDTVCLSNPTECGCDDVNQEDYRGTISVTEDGIECQAWNSNTPHAHTDNPSAYPYHDLTNNYCRSPTGGIPWCYTTDVNVEWGYCRIPSCPTETTTVSSVGGGEGGQEQQSDMEDPISAIPTKSPVTLAPVTLEPSSSPTVSSNIFQSSLSRQHANFLHYCSSWPHSSTKYN